MSKHSTIVIACLGVGTGLMLLPCSVRADPDSSIQTSTAEKGWSIAVSAPVAKISISKTTTFQPNFIPGPGVGYVWFKGMLGIFMFPGLSVTSSDAIIVPPLALHGF